ncbi:MAG TPA: sialidase family protein [Candidatus Lokiarchaeia archaeon]|nr:sialidase family protein [Candidatus Lokiarchaeia archaeon]
MLKIAEGLTVETLTKPVPGLLHHAHCSGIVAFPDGELFAVYYHAITEANRKQAIYAVRKKPGDEQWSDPVKIMSHPHMMTGNPAIWIAPDTGKLWLFYVNSIGGWSVCNPRCVTSNDRGLTWSKPKKLYWFISRGIKNPAIVTSKGRYVLPAYIEFRDYFGIFYISDDQGKTWKERGRVQIPDVDVPEAVVKARNSTTGRLLLQPTVVEKRDGTLWALMRASRPLGKMYQTTSTNGGETWSSAIPYILPNPGGGFHMMRLQSGNLAIIYNHAPVPEENHGFARNPLSVAISEDDGETWAYRRNIMEAHDDDVNQGIGGYPTMTQGADGTIHATWSFSHPGEVEGTKVGFTDIKYTSFTEDWVKEQPFFGGAFEE